MQSDEIVCIAQVTAKKGKAEALRQALFSLIAPSRKESGVLRYELNVDLENPNSFIMVEKYINSAAFDLHCNMEYLKHFLENTVKELVETIDVKLYKEHFE